MDVQAVLDQAAAGDVRLLLSAINAGETFYVLGKRHSSELAELFRQQLPNMPLAVIVPDMEAIWKAATAKRNYAISYADAFAAALTAHFDADLMTGDPEFRSVPVTVIWLRRD